MHAPRRVLLSTASNATLTTILSATPASSRAAVCAAWDGLLPERREFLSNWSPEILARWLLGILREWQDNAPLNALPEGGYARQVEVMDAFGAPAWVWCRVPTASARVGELIPCEQTMAHAGTRIAFELRPNGFASATTMPLPERVSHADILRY